MDRCVEMDAGTDSQTGKDKTQIDGAQPSHSMDTEDQATDPVKDMGNPEGDTADVTEPISAEDVKGSIAEAEALSSGYANFGQHVRSLITALFPGTEPNMDPYVKDAEQGKVCAGSECFVKKLFEISSLTAQEIPEDIKHQRRLLKDFYEAWREEKFGVDRTYGHRLGSAISLLSISSEEYGVRDCEALFTSADDFTSAYSQMASVFLLCANVYPKYAPACYTLAESCFNMAKISSRLLSASWKLSHAFTMSLTRSGLDEIRYPLSNLMSKMTIPLFFYLQLYSDLVAHVMTNKSFERDEFFQRGYKHPPAESQILTFTSALSEAEVMLNETFGQIRELVQPEGDQPEQEEVPASSSACDESQGAETKTEFQKVEESEMSKNLCGVKGLIKKFAGDMQVLGRLLMNLKISKC